jgi:hypothetical protein
MKCHKAHCFMVNTCVHFVMNNLAFNTRSGTKVHTSHGIVFFSFLLSLLKRSLYGLTHKCVLEVDVCCVMLTVDSSVHEMSRLFEYDGQFSGDLIVCKKCRVQTIHLNYFFLFCKFYMYFIGVYMN